MTNGDYQSIPVKILEKWY